MTNSIHRWSSRTTAATGSKYMMTCCTPNGHGRSYERDIDMLGYRTGLQIIDTVGLTTPAARDCYPADTNICMNNDAIPPDLILDIAPDRIVILEAYGRPGLVSDPQLSTQYELTHWLETDIRGSDGILIFSRR